nr:hypothetical protein [Tanacetum cinerariifolium]
MKELEEGSFDPIPRTPERSKEESNDDEDQELRLSEEARIQEEEEEADELESFDPIPRTPEGSEDEGSDEEDQELRLSEEARIQEEEEKADKLYRDVNINQGRGLQVTQNIKDSHVTLTPVHPDGPQESSTMSSFVTSMLNPISDAGVESIFTKASSPIEWNPFSRRHLLRLYLFKPQHL